MLFLLLTYLGLAQAESLVLYPGQAQSLPASSHQKILIEKKGPVSVKDQGRHLQIVGRKVGTTRLSIGSKDYEIKVISEKLFKTFQKLREWQKNKLGPLVAVDNGKIFIRGKIHTLLDWQSLAETMNSDDEFSLQAKIDRDTLEKIKRHLKDLSNANNIPFGVFNQNPEWEISLNSTEKENTPTYRKIFAPLGIKINQSSHALSAVPMIEVNILAAEVKKSELSKIGVTWPATAQAQLVPAFVVDPTSLFVNVDFFEQQGWGKVLASPTLLAQSGEDATFHSGGEFPIKTSSRYNNTVNWKKYGIILKIKPRADYNGKMSIDIECEVSTLDMANAIDGIPGLLVNRISSHFTLTETKTIALSGLLKHEINETQAGMPGFKNIPIFSQLFSSKQYQNNQSELVFFVTPRIIK